MAPPSLLPLSIFIIAKNEADRLPRTLASVSGLSPDVVVVDSGSSDDTIAVAEALGARVLYHAFSGYGPQKRYAEEQCTQPWLLNLDADEVLPTELVDEIRALFAGGEPSHDAFTLKIAEVFPGEGTPHAWAYRLMPVRLYRRDKGRYRDSPVHDRVELQAGTRVGHLRGTALHFSVRSLGDQIGKLNAYTDQQVADLAARGKRVASIRLWLEFPAAFLKAYVLRRHFVRGRYGFMTAMNFGFYRWLRVAKAMERQMLERRSAKDRPL